MIYENIYGALDRLCLVAAIEAQTEAAKSVSAPFMDLHFDLLYEQDGTAEIALAHYFKLNGDACCDPDMRIRVNLADRVAEALAFQQAIPPIYREVYPEPGQVDIAAKTELNKFLLFWLRNCIAQGHTFEGHTLEGGT